MERGFPDGSGRKQERMELIKNKLINIAGMGFLVAALVAPYYPSPGISLAAENIKSVSVHFEIDGFDSDGIPVLSAETAGSKYSAGDIVTLIEYEEDEEDVSESSQLNLEKKALSQMVYVVELEASQGYHFSGNNKIKLSGAGAACVKSERKESRTILAVYVKFPELDDMVGEVETASWDGGGRGTWSHAQNSVKYEIRLLYQGKMAGSKKMSGGNSYDFRPMMKKAGSYRFSVRPVSAVSKQVQWRESDEFQVSEEAARQNRLESDNPAYLSTSLNAGWQSTSDGFWWYREKDGAYLQKNWLSENGWWYFFDEKGYLVKADYVKWGKHTYYMDGNGQMITDGKAPDGRVADSLGTLEWPER